MRKPGGVTLGGESGAGGGVFSAEEENLEDMLESQEPRREEMTGEEAALVREGEEVVCERVGWWTTTLGSGEVGGEVEMGGRETVEVAGVGVELERERDSRRLVSCGTEGAQF